MSTSEDKAIEEIIRSLNEEKSNEKESILHSRKLTKSITEVIAKMLMPLNQHSNLNEALEREIENITPKLVEIEQSILPLPEDGVLCLFSLAFLYNHFRHWRMKYVDKLFHANRGN
ncbi:MAG: hypothetical protein PUP91_33920 [Rhizonema sp. PD37]|nr:hypothetical protein [Rhizonema sp. PD37]